MERLVSFIIGVIIILVSNLLSNFVTDGVILETAWIKITNLGALTVAGIGAVIYAIPPVVFTSLGNWLFKMLRRNPEADVTPSVKQEPPTEKNPPWESKK